MNEHIIRSTGNAIARLTRGNGRVAIVNYHRVLAAPSPFLRSEPDIGIFTWQMELLARCFNVLSLREALAAIDSGRVPPRAVCITFDDGYRSVHDLALPVLRRLGLPATVFVSSGYVDGRNMWNDRIVEAVETLPAEELDLAEFGLGVYSLRTIPERTATLGSLTEASKYLPPQERSRLVGRLQTLVGERSSEGLMLTPEMVVNLDRNGIEIGAHTVTHPILTSLDDASAMQEIRDSKRELEAIVGKPVTLFAYPNGKVGKDFDQRHVAMVREAGFQAGFTTAVGAITRHHDRYQLARSRPWDETPMRFALRLLQWLARG
ncbi:polysaccharide deacetylase family protein [Massilia sp.]|uniref:polysaccharide deacetylase family protein n=1 Tax=Massilia sp. TaxID=1882437 RepID=UPI0028AC8505|nr:polysaccharide deacetylase family protein [Massilia sp.]